MTGEGRDRLQRFFQREDAKKAAQEEQETEEQKAVQSFLEDAMSRCLGTVKPAMEEATALFTGPDRSAGVDVREGEGVFVIDLVVAIEGRNSRLIFAANTDTRKVDVSRHISDLTGETVGAYPPSEITGDVVQKHVDDFLGGLVPQQ